MAKKIIFLGIIIPIFYSCSSYVPPRYETNSFKYSEKSYDLEFYWNVKYYNNFIELDGIIKNVRYYNIRSFLLDTYLFDKEGRLISKANFDYRHDILKPEEIIPFLIKFEFNDKKPYKIKFSYRYYFNEENKFSNDFVIWSFEKLL